MTALPFEFGPNTVRDMTHAIAKRMMRVVRRIARGEVDPAVVVEARRVVLEVKERQQARHREEARVRRTTPTKRENRNGQD